MTAGARSIRAEFEAQYSNLVRPVSLHLSSRPTSSSRQRQSRQGRKAWQSKSKRPSKAPHKPLRINAVSLTPAVQMERSVLKTSKSLTMLRPKSSPMRRSLSKTSVQAKWDPLTSNKPTFNRTCYDISNTSAWKVVNNSGAELLYPNENEQMAREATIATGSHLKSRRPMTAGSIMAQKRQDSVMNALSSELPQGGNLSSELPKGASLAQSPSPVSPYQPGSNTWTQQVSSSLVAEEPEAGDVQRTLAELAEERRIERQKHWEGGVDCRQYEREALEKQQALHQQEMDDLAARYNRQCSCMSYEERKEHLLKAQEEAKNRKSRKEILAERKKARRARLAAKKKAKEEKALRKQEAEEFRRKNDMQDHLRNVRRQIWLKNREEAEKEREAEDARYDRWLEEILGGNEVGLMDTGEAVLANKIALAKKKRQFAELSGEGVAQEAGQSAKKQLMAMDREEMELIFNTFDEDGSGGIDPDEVDGVVKVVAGTICDVMKKTELSNLQKKHPFKVDEELERMYWVTNGAQVETMMESLKAALRKEFLLLMKKGGGEMDKTLFLNSWSGFIARAVKSQPRKRNFRINSPTSDSVSPLVSPRSDTRDSYYNYATEAAKSP